MDKYKLFLDDVRQAQECASYMHLRIGHRNPIYLDEWKIVRNYKEFVEYIERNGLPTHISFDHDLADEHYLLGNARFTNWDEYHKDSNREMTGADCAKWLIQYIKQNKKELPICFVHSMNPVGAKNIIDILNG